MAAPQEPPATATVLVIASGNAGKIREFAHLLASLPLEVRPQPDGLEVEETGSSFAANARLKAEAVARATGHWALADDSGLAVAALGGAPGVHSARYADSDASRIARLLLDLGETDRQRQEQGLPSDRRAAFVAALAIADPTGAIRLEVEGRCDGEILEAPRGGGGFGYDPVFFVASEGLSYAEMDKERKGRIGHRGKAFVQLEPGLRDLLAITGDQPDSKNPW
ncbi:RdgB/HAM1 family non-canonical purine NTP pyrophosphatase [Cyanobium sp. N5-Cardenillas]|uniref:RdgB/HAM1 family non-canonical purine NTP pyrophosphatase n=1 Tax=Cyanobium sp. N5-Cardenillas TaxID=2823720 RepID=UPI0020CF0757|nr:RdgB/HAM1 family non-canonical purine NTP pyrophosphatase [Cyanobium sp. N5-Cardenillas]MCP9785200.1 RdgB/HAM1 family non-canonical purine NTP pyrophosphatase [Cyanobium sp. N5-Cardenillas]